MRALPTKSRAAARSAGERAESRIAVGIPRKSTHRSAAAAESLSGRGGGTTSGALVWQAPATASATLVRAMERRIDIGAGIRERYCGTLGALERTKRRTFVLGPGARPRAAYRVIDGVCNFR